VEVVTVPLDAPPLRFEILGRLRAWRGDIELDLGPGKQRAVLAVLLLNPNRPVQTASIVDAVWGEDPPDNGANVVQKYVAGLRRVLEPDRSPRAPARVLELTGAGYVLHVPPDGLDAEVFQKRVRHALAARTGSAGHGRPAGAAETVERLGEALAMWRETPLAGPTGPVFDAARDRLVEERAAALEACAEIELELGRHARLVPELIRLVDDFPLREGARYLLMLALYRSGRQAEALAAYRDARAFLAEEFGVEPGERLQDLHLRILRSDPSLLNWAPVDDPAPTAAPTASSASFAPPTPLDSPDPTTTLPQHPPVMPPQGWTVHAGFPHPNGAPPVDRIDRRLSLELRIGVVVVTLLTCGMLNWAVVAYFAGRRRSPWQGLAAVGWFALVVFFWLGISYSDPYEWRLIDDLTMITAPLLIVGGIVHVVLLSSGHPPLRADGARGPDAGDAWIPGPDPGAVEMIRRRTRQEQARALLVRHPSIAQELRIGRPDLPRTFDDGGLVDVNAVPEHVLALLPGLGPQYARLIVTVREVQGPFGSIDDLIARGIVPAEVIRPLHETLIAVPWPVDSPPPGATDSPPPGGTDSPPPGGTDSPEAADPAGSR
jgi:DNA-binding SARP family transcriptional activator